MPQLTTQADLALKERLTTRAQMLRAYEANCGIDHPDPETLALRAALGKALAREWGLRELRSFTLSPTQPATH